ncbi:hypothetical protein HX109_12965 [Galbibacter sp. BG1]|uniref:SMP-30/gluconolactonase/LRE family protein n=1 Tax=Galbibacter sp. BG1 TaxID=1170699 RepID=UPI0015BE4C88|nr:hypothetical protein [Galbibacter sp. BG1]QLE02421.1 hypothetical protein HX109_12965 [Galbibacter sp. BG1]
MDRKIYIVFIVFLTTISGWGQKLFPYRLEKGFEVSGFDAPESVLKDPENNVLYISNINGEPAEKDGNGYISKLGIDGSIIERKWIDGLNAPKGMGIYKGKLYVADIDVVVEIDIQTRVRKIHKTPDATFLNDITVDREGNVYISNTFGFSGIYRLSPNGTVTLWMKDKDLQMPNGLLMDGKSLLVANWGVDLDPKTYETKTKGNILKVDTVTKRIMDFIGPLGNLDGIVETGEGYFVTDWLSGKLWYTNLSGQRISIALQLPKGIADVGYDQITETLYVPLMLDGKLVSYKLLK